MISIKEKNKTNSINKVITTKDELKVRQEKYNALINTHSNDLYRYALWLAKDKHIAEEALQETYIKAWRSFEDLKEPKAVKGWLITILRREHARYYSRKRLDMSDVEDLDTLAMANMGVDSSPESFVLRQALDKLDKSYSEPLVMSVVLGFTSKEIAESMNISTSAVMTRLHRARAKMRELLAADDFTTNRFYSIAAYSASLKPNQL